MVRPAEHLVGRIALSVLSVTVFSVVVFGNSGQRIVKLVNVLDKPPRNLLIKKVDMSPFPGTQFDNDTEISWWIDGEHDTLVFDDGEPESAYYWLPGYRMATRLSPDTGQTECKILGVIYYHWTPGAFHPAIFEWSGSSPADTLLEWDDTSTVAGFNTFMVDTAEIVVEGDFVVSHGCVDSVTSLGFYPYNNGRAWDYTPVTGSWTPWVETYFIRAIVEYPPYGAVPPNIDILTPQSAMLDPPYPNPFNPVTTFVIHRRQSGPISLKIYDLLGREVASLINGVHSTGTVNVSWDARSHSSGIYWAVLADHSDTVIRKLVLLK